MLVGPDEICGVDQQAKEAVLLDRIKSKINKRYAKPEAPLWLLVWTASTDYVAFWNEDGKSLAVDLARKHLSANGAEPFEQVWFHNLCCLNPMRLWPV